MSRALNKQEQTRVEALLPMVSRLCVAVSRECPSVGRQDLEAVGREALVIAMSRHDPKRGDLDAYAFIWVRGEMRNHCRKTLRLRERERMLPLSVAMGIAPDERTAGERFDAGLDATPEEDRQEIVEWMRFRTAGVLAELTARPGLQDAEDEHLRWRARALGHQVIEKAESLFGEPERTVFKSVFRDELTLEQVAEQLGKSKRTVQRIVDKVRVAIACAILDRRVD